MQEMENLQNNYLEITEATTKVIKQQKRQNICGKE